MPGPGPAIFPNAKPSQQNPPNAARKKKKAQGRYSVHGECTFWVSRENQLTAHSPLCMHFSPVVASPLINPPASVPFFFSSPGLFLDRSADRAKRPEGDSSPPIEDVPWPGSSWDWIFPLSLPRGVGSYCMYGTVRQQRQGQKRSTLS